MNRPIRTLSVFCFVLFLALMANATYLQFVKAKSLNDDPANRRVIQAAFSRQRGAILAGKTAVAHSVPKNDQFKFQRVYPKSTEYAPLTGFFSYYSQTGIEHSQNQVLSGDDSRLFVRRLIDLVNNTDPKGGNVELTIDPAVQDAAYNGFKALGDGVEGAAVAIEPSTGRILAMVSTPSFDPNVMADHDLTASTKAYDRLVKDPAEPLINRAIQTTLPPGSTFKLITSAAAIEDLGMTPDSMVDGRSSMTLPQTTHVLHNENNFSCGATRVTLTTALDKSCNVAFAGVGLKLTDAQLRKQAEKFGFGQTYLTDLPGQAASRFPSSLTPPLRALSAIGPPRAPPAISLRPVLLDCTRTATAIFGLSAGANPVNQAYGGRSAVLCAVPVLPATLTPEIRAGVPVPRSTTDVIISVSMPAVLGETAVESAVGLVWSSTSRSADVIRSTTYGFITTPWLAMPADTIAICSGVAATSYCPMDDSARSGGVSVVGKRLVA